MKEGVLLNEGAGAAVKRRRLLAAAAPTAFLAATGLFGSTAAGADPAPADLVRADSLADLLSIPVSGLADGQLAWTSSMLTPVGSTSLWASEEATGGGLFAWVAGRSKADHNGGTVISPTVPFAGSAASLPDFLAGVGESTPTGAGCWVRSAGASVNPTWFGAVPDGETDSYAALIAARDFAVASQIRNIEFPAGVFAFSQPLNFAFDYLTVRGAGNHNTYLKATGPGRAVNFDANEFGTRGVNALTVEAFSVVGNSATTEVLHIESVARSVFRDLDVWGADGQSGVGVSIGGNVANRFEGIHCSVNESFGEEHRTPRRPSVGLSVGKSVAKGTPSVANTFVNTIIEGAATVGIDLGAAVRTAFLGGTAEANGRYGAVVSDEAEATVFIDFDFESNGFNSDLTTADVVDSGRGSRYESATTTRMLQLTDAAWGVEITGGKHHRIQIDSGATESRVTQTVVNLSYVHNGRGGYFDDGTGTRAWAIADDTSGAEVATAKPVTAIEVGPSPFVYRPAPGRVEQVAVLGGVVSSLALRRDGSSVEVGSALRGPRATQLVTLAAGDELSITYSSAPQLTVIPIG
jgi:hypothetical protein